MIMSYGNDTLFITDLDGTLMRNDKSISQKSADIINRIVGMGIPFTFATARSYQSAMHIVSPLDLKLPAITRNGTVLADPVTWTLIEKAVFTEDETELLLKIIPEVKDCGFTSIWHGDEMSKIYCSEGEHTGGMLDYIEEHRNKGGLTPVSSREEMFEGNVGYITMIDSHDKLLPIYERVKTYPCWECVLQLDAYSSDYWLEICPENCTKAKAILKLKERFGFKKIVAFGDSTNDIPMFRIADEAYAVSNADDTVKAYATDIIESNEEDGVAKFLQKHLL